MQSSLLGGTGLELLQEQRIAVAVGGCAHEVVDMSVPRRHVPAIERGIIDALQPLERALGRYGQVAPVELAGNERDRDAQVLGTHVAWRLGDAIAAQVLRAAVVELRRCAALDDLREMAKRGHVARPELLA